MEVDQVLGQALSPIQYQSSDSQSELQDEPEAAVIQNVKYLLSIGYFSRSWFMKPKDEFFSRRMVNINY